MFYYGRLPITRILIANRGEIAVRIARTCREMGISAIAVFTGADRGASHAQAADKAVCVGESYLNVQRLIDCAQQTGAGAVHPGYGFLSENAEFAEACAQAGLIFIGPSPLAIRTLGSKTAARQIAALAGVPVVPEYSPSGPIEFPIIVKASAGGGGRGMRIVHHRDDLDEAMKSARGEAQRAFGDGTLLLEKYISNARHIELQIFGDRHGNVIHLHERDCSVQRRHQKLIEESPAPEFPEELRERMGEAAIAVGRAVHYTSAGTIEFLLGPDGEFYFIEANTRIQVEHAVTELVTGIDLVRLQIEVAEGKPLLARVNVQGAAIEARLCAEDPSNGFLPSTGKIEVWRSPGDVRVDTALQEQASIGVEYDSLLAKIVAFGSNREDARRKLVHALERTVLLGVVTNREYLIQLLQEEPFKNGAAHTAWLPQPAASKVDWLEYAAALVLHEEHTRKRSLRGVPANYRNNPYRDPSLKLDVNGQEVDVTWRRISDHRFQVNEREVEIISFASDSITLVIDRVQRTYNLKSAGETTYIWSAQSSAVVKKLTRYPRKPGASAQSTANSPMPGKVLRIVVEKGQPVSVGDPLVVLEAMKMEQTIRTTIDGIVVAILVEPGQVVMPAQKLVEINAREII
jgi:propionyl-CoA carboxylase alpha chain